MRLLLSFSCLLVSVLTGVGAVNWTNKVPNLEVATNAVVRKNLTVGTTNVILELASKLSLSDTNTFASGIAARSIPTASDGNWRTNGTANPATDSSLAGTATVGLLKSTNATGTNVFAGQVSVVATNASGGGIVVGSGITNQVGAITISIPDIGSATPSEIASSLALVCPTAATITDNYNNAPPLYYYCQSWNNGGAVAEPYELMVQLNPPAPGDVVRQSSQRWYFADNGNPADPLRFTNDPLKPQPAMYLTSTGHLHAEGSLYAKEFVISDTFVNSTMTATAANGDSQLTLVPNGNGVAYFAYGSAALSSPLVFYSYKTGTGEAMRITATRDVGIATNAPSEKLEVAGNIKASGGLSLAGTASAGNGFNIGTNKSAVGDFVIVAIPDSQNDDLAAYQATVAWITTNVFPAPLVGVIGLGDVVDDSSIPAQWENSTNMWYSVPSDAFQIPIPGNHDYNGGGTLTEYNTYYGQSYLTNRPWWSATTGGFYQAANHGENMWLRRQYGLQSFLFIGMEYNPADAILNWVSNTAALFPDDRVIVATHDHIRPSGLLEGLDPSDDPYPGGTNNGSNTWYKCFQYIPNLCLVVSGHELDVSGKPLRGQLPGTFGNRVNQVMANYQLIGDGMGWLRVLHFQPSANRCTVTSFDTKTVAYSTIPADQFGFEIVKYDPLDYKDDQVLVTTTQNNTNVVVNFNIPGMRIVTATNDLYFTHTNMPSLVQRTISYRIATGTTNRWVSFGTGIGIGAPLAAYLYPSNHVLRIDHQSHGALTNDVDVFISQQLP